MEYVCVDVRFYFWNGNNGYTVEYGYACADWWVFKDHETSNALWKKEVNPKKIKSPNRDSAEAILEEYLDTIPQTVNN